MKRELKRRTESPKDFTARNIISSLDRTYFKGELRFNKTIAKEMAQLKEVLFSTLLKGLSD